MRLNNDVADNYSHYLNLRKTYPIFIYHGYKTEYTEKELRISYDFEIRGLSRFRPVWNFPLCDHNPTMTTAFHNAVFYLGMVELISYWKLTCSEKVIIKGKSLDPKEIRWWKKLYFNGLGEFYYRNGILQKETAPNAEKMMEIVSEPVPDHRAQQGFGHDILNDKTSLEGCLVPIGGGKDSAVSLELLRRIKMKKSCYIINPRGATLDTAAVYGFDQKDIHQVNRTLCPEMLRLNKEGFLNGHTPFSAIVAFSSTITAMLCKKKYIVLSNEDSANENTVTGSHVNHQYSKSYEFEKDFVEYEKEYIKSGTYYFSLLRPLCELQIAKLFAENCQRYFPVFKSCNVGSKENIWCASCSKCLFVYLILAPFIEDPVLLDIFGKDLVEDETMLSDFDRLIGLTAEKPFECVGSIDEINTAVHMRIDRLLNTKAPIPLLYRHYIDKGLYLPDRKKDFYLKHFNQENGIPEKFKKEIYHEFL